MTTRYNNAEIRARHGAANVSIIPPPEKKTYYYYDFDVDRTETNNIAAQFPEMVRELSAAWDAWADKNQVTPLPDDLGVPYLKADNRLEK